jgi:hypothetical protein
MKKRNSQHACCGTPVGCGQYVAELVGSLGSTAGGHRPYGCDYSGHFYELMMPRMESLHVGTRLSSGTR